MCGLFHGFSMNRISSSLNAFRDEASWKVLPTCHPLLSYDPHLIYCFCTKITTKTSLPTLRRWAEGKCCCFLGQNLQYSCSLDYSLYLTNCFLSSFSANSCSLCLPLLSMEIFSWEPFSRTCSESCSCCPRHHRHA